MKCNKCGKEILVNQYHTCEGSSKREVKRSVLKEPVRNINSYSYVLNQNAAIITPGFNMASVEELEEMANKGNGLKSEVHRIVTTLKTVVKNPTPKNLIVMVSAVISILIWAITIYNPYFSYMPASGMKGLLAVIFGTYNNIVARTLHFSSVFSLLSVFIPQLIEQKSISVGSIPKAFRKIKDVLQDVKSKQFGLVVMGTGLAYVFGNIMMRNNSMNKYLACATFGVTLLLAGGELRGTSFVRLMYAIMNDLKRLLRMNQFLESYGELLRQSFGFGLVSTVVLSLLRKVLPYTVGDKLGYVLGTVLVVAGLVIQLRAKTSKQS